MKTALRPVTTKPWKDKDKERFLEVSKEKSANYNRRAIKFMVDYASKPIEAKSQEIPVHQEFSIWQNCLSEMSVIIYSQMNKSLGVCLFYNMS